MTIPEHAGQNGHQVAQHGETLQEPFTVRSRRIARSGGLAGDFPQLRICVLLPQP
jgi:hypothetical protein